MKIYFIAGESSGDAHAAVLMRDLRSIRPDIEFYGAGGPKMRAVAGAHLYEWTQEAVVGLWDVLVKYAYFRTQFYRMYDEICRLKPDAVVFVDYPGFNLRLANYLHRRGFSRKLIYYISPQVWAWNRSRIPRMAKFLDLMMCIFPFEKPLYEASGLRTEFVGHPMIEELAGHSVSGERDSTLIGLFPGSREREVKRIFPVMLKAADLLRNRDSAIRFAAAAASEKLRNLMSTIAEEAGFRGLAIGLKNSTELMQRCSVGIVASGTATMESSFFRLPFVLVYKVSWLTYLAGRILVRVDYLGMPNILAGKQIIPEFIQHDAKPVSVANAAWDLYSDPEERRTMIQAMDCVIATLGKPGGGKRAAQVLTEELRRR
jgi:lipid-A-disaccharide synthase